MHRSAAAGVAQGVGGKLADGEYQVGDAQWSEPSTPGPAGDEAANRVQVVTVAQRLARCPGATLSRTRSGSPPNMTQFGYTAMGEQTPPGS